MSVFAGVMLAAALGLLAVAEGPRLAKKLGRDDRRSRERNKQKSKLKLIESTPDLDSEEDFIRAVERDLAALPTIDEHDVKRQ